MRSKRALPNEAVQRQFVWAKFVGQAFWAAQWKRWANGFVGFLGVFYLRLIHARFGGQELVAIRINDLVAHGAKGLNTKDDGVGTHVGDVTGFI